MTEREPFRLASRPDDGLGVGRHTLALFVAVALSVLAHFGLLLLCAPMRFGGVVPQVPEAERALADLPPLRVTLVQEPLEQAPTGPAAPDPAAAAEQSARATADRAEAAPLPAPEAPALPQVAPHPAPPPPPEAAIPEAPRAPDFPLPDLPGTVGAAPAPRWSLDAPRAAAPTAPALADALAGGPAPDAPLVPTPVPGAAPALGPDAPVAPLPAPTPARGVTPNAAAISARALADALAKPEAAAPVFREIDDRLALALSVQDSPADPDHRYFRLDIRRRPDSPLPIMPKDVLIVQDVSGSIGADRLAAAKRVLKAALANTLRQGDRFIVFAFRHNTLTPSDAWRPYDADSKAYADAFIDSLRAVGNTDILNLLTDILTLPADPARPLIAVLVSDGDPTVGDTRTAHIISEFSGKNDGRIAIYAFATGASGKRTSHYDPYFLDLLSYANRGESVTASGDVAALADELAPLFDSIRHPVLKDPVLTFDSASGGEVHPRHLTHLFADRPLIVYGRVPKSAKTVTCQLRGQAADDAYDAVFTFDLADAPRADHDLRADWARRALFDLLVNYEANPSEALLRRIGDFAARHGLPNPYRR